MRICSIEGCEKRHFGKGYCNLHYKRLRRNGDPLFIKQKRKCSIKDCRNKHFSNGYCRIHWQRWYRHGDPLITKNHGMTKTSEHRAWAGMKQRCLNKKDPSYKNYGRRGIIVCDKWKNSFLAFYKDMGPRPFPRAQIDRIDNGGNYAPENCRWTTIKINTQNSRGAKLTTEIAEQIRKEYIFRVVTQRMLGKKYGVDPTTIGYVLRGITWA